MRSYTHVLGLPAVCAVLLVSVLSTACAELPSDQAAEQQVQAPAERPSNSASPAAGLPPPEPAIPPGATNAGDVANGVEANADRAAQQASAPPASPSGDSAAAPQPAPLEVAATPQATIVDQPIDCQSENAPPDCARADAPVSVTAQGSGPPALSSQLATIEPDTKALTSDEGDIRLKLSSLWGKDILNSLPRTPLTVHHFEEKHARGSILILTSERRLFYFIGEHSALEFPIGIARRNLQRIGHTQIIEKRLNPTWVPTSLQHRVYRNLPGSVSPGPDNPLGTRALNLTIPNIRIHGTNDDSFIGAALSDGCFRMYNQDIEFLYEIVSVGTQVMILR